MSDVPAQLWRWVRGEMPHDEFGYWLYDHADSIKVAVPTDVAAELTNLDFWPAPVTGSDAEQMRERLVFELPRRCACPLMFDRQRIPLGAQFPPHEFEKAFQTIATRTPWLRLSLCRECGQNWYVACDTADDYWYFERLDPGAAGRILELNQWPSTFDGWAHLWPADAEHRAGSVHIDEFRRGIVASFISVLSTR